MHMKSTANHRNLCHCAFRCSQERPERGGHAWVQGSFPCMSDAYFLFLFAVAPSTVNTHYSICIRRTIYLFETQQSLTQHTPLPPTGPETQYRENKGLSSMASRCP